MNVTQTILCNQQFYHITQHHININIKILASTDPMLKLNQISYHITMYYLIVLASVCNIVLAYRIAYETNITGSVVISDSNGIYIAVCSQDGNLTVYKNNGGNYVEIKVQGVNVWIPPINLGPIAYEDAQKYLPKIADADSFMYFMDGNTGMVAAADLSLLAPDNPDMLAMYLAGHGCTNPYLCFIAHSLFPLDQPFQGQVGPLISLYDHSSRRLTVYVHNRFYISTVLVCNVADCSAFNHSQMVGSGYLVADYLELQFRTPSTSSYYQFPLINTTSTPVLSVVRQTSDVIFSMMMTKQAYFEPNAPYTALNGEVLGKKCISVWGGRQRYAQQIYFIKQLPLDEAYLISFWNNNSYALELRRNYSLEMAIIETARITSVTITSTLSLAYTTADGRLVIVEHVGPQLEPIDRRPNRTNPTPTPTDATLSTDNDTLCISWDGSKRCYQVMSILWAAITVASFALFVILVFGCIFMVVFCRNKYKAYKEGKDYIEQYGQSSFNKSKTKLPSQPRSTKTGNLDNDSFAEKNNSSRVTKY